MGNTSQNQIDEMRDLVAAMEENESIKEAIVDDWGRYGNFQILVVPNEHTRSATLKIKALVKKVISDNNIQAQVREIISPEPIRESWFDGYRRVNKVVGYSRSFWMIDIDYSTYHPEINAFDCQLDTTAP